MPNSPGDGIQAELQRLTQLLTGTEGAIGSAEGLRLFEEGRAYAVGTTVPILGQRAQMDRGLLLVGERGRRDYDFMGTYVTVREYIPAELLGDLDEAVQRIADSVTREQMLIALAVVNRISAEANGMERLTAEFLACVDPSVRARLELALREPTGGLGHRIVAPQPLLCAMRWLLGRPPVATPTIDERAPILGLAILFCHVVGATLATNKEHEGDADEPLTEAQQKRLMIGMMNLGSLSDPGDIYASIDRTLRLWRDYGHLAQERCGKPAVELLRDATGLEPEDFLALGFATVAHGSAIEGGGPVLLNPALSPDLPEGLVDRFLAAVSCSLEEALDTWGPPRTEADLIALEAAPVLRLRDGLLVTDEALLWQRCSFGLFWMVHDYMRAAGSKARDHWMGAYAAMVEIFVEDSLRATAPPTLAPGSVTFYTEEDLERAYGQVERCDVCIDFGHTFLLVEVVAGQLTVPTRVESNLEKLDADLSKLIFEKVEQLNSTAQLLIADEAPLTSVASGKRFPGFVPAVVVGGGLQLNMLTYSYIRSRIEASGLLTHSRVSGVAILDLEDVEHLEGLAERGYEPCGLLRDWQNSDHRDLPFNNFLGTFVGSDRRPARMEPRYHSAMADLFGRIGMPPPPGPGSAA